MDQDILNWPWAAWAPDDLARRLDGVAAPWYVVGGWALDLWHGRETRPHDDLEFCILRPDFDRFRTALAPFDLFQAGAGRVTPLDGDPHPDCHQFWALDGAARHWVVDMMIEPGIPAQWAYKRDPALRAPRAEMVLRSATGIPYLAPQGVLLFKAKHLRPKDLRDFDLALPHLDSGQRHWLRDALDRLHPDHLWRDRL